jgi:cell division protein FtsB
MSGECWEAFRYWLGGCYYRCRGRRFASKKAQEIHESMDVQLVALHEKLGDYRTLIRERYHQGASTDQLERLVKEMLRVKKKHTYVQDLRQKTGALLDNVALLRDQKDMVTDTWNLLWAAQVIGLTDSQVRDLAARQERTNAKLEREEAKTEDECETLLDAGLQSLTKTETPAEVTELLKQILSEEVSEKDRAGGSKPDVGACLLLAPAAPTKRPSTTGKPSAAVSLPLLAELLG